MRLLAAFLFAGCLAIVAAFSDEAASAAYYEGRSGEILFKSAAWSEPECFVSVLNKKLPAAHIDDVSVADLISHVSGRFLPLNLDVDRTEFPSVNIFTPPMATIVTSIPSLSRDDVRFMPSLAGQSLTSVRGTAYPSDSLSRLTTMLSGASPSVHGIVGSSWPTSIGLVTAYVSEFGQPRAVNFPTLVSTAFSGKGLVLSASGSAQHASAMNALPSLLKDHSYWNNMQVFWNGEDVVASSPFKKEYFNRKEFVGLLLNSVALPANAKVEYDTATGSLSIALPKGASAKFDLSKHEDMLLFAELRIASYIVSLLEKNEAVKDLATDSIPDLFSISFVSLEALKAAYGPGSAHVNVALAMIDAAVSSLNHAMLVSYKDAVASVVLAVAVPQRTALSSAIMQELISSDIIVMEPHPENFLPSVYVQRTAQPADEARLCTTITTLAAESGLNVICRFSDKHGGGSRARDVESHAVLKRDELTKSPGDISSDDLQVFHTVLWSSVIIALAIGGTILVMCSIDTTKDTLLFRVSKASAH